MTFENGWTVSVQWGPGNYWKAAMRQEFWKSGTAEVAVWNHAGDWVEFGSDHVEGHVTVERVASLLAIVSSLGREARTFTLEGTTLSLETKEG
jgi:hypothetical protein